MRLLTFGTIALLSVGGIAFEVTIYEDADHCNPDDQTVHRVLTGADGWTCHKFYQAMPGVDCVQYSNGNTTTGGCDGSPLPKSVFAGGQVTCLFSAFDNCEWPVDPEINTCATANFSWQNIDYTSFRSFQCVDYKQYWKTDLEGEP